METRIRTCFISSVAGTSLGTLRAVLAEKGVRVVVPEEIYPGLDWSAKLSSIISHVDLVIGVLTRERRSSWVFLELGQAVAFGKQVLVFAPPQIEGPPFVLHRFLIVRASLSNRKAISFALDQVLASPPPPDRTTESKPKEKHLLGQHADRLLHELHLATEARDWHRIESITADALRLGGVDVISEATIRNRRVDLALWSDALQPIMGNPLLVEVKASLHDGDAARQAAQQLSAASAEAGSGWGLLLYAKSRTTNEGLQFVVPPNVLVLSLPTLLNEMRNRSFAEIVQDLRNQRVHGVGPDAAY
jgi:hypothetical protein